MRTTEQMTAITTRALKEVHKELVKKWGFPVNVIAGATFGLGVTMMAESGHTEEQLVEFVRQVVADLRGPPAARGAS